MEELLMLDKWEAYERNGAAERFLSYLNPKKNMNINAKSFTIYI